MPEQFGGFVDAARETGILQGQCRVKPCNTSTDAHYAGMLRFICSAPGLLQSHRVNCTQTLLVDQALPMPFFLHSFVMLDTTQERDVI